MSLGDKKGLSTKPVEAARTLIIRGKFDGAGKKVIPPLIWADSYEANPTWEIGKTVVIKVDDALESMGERIDAWISRPATELNRFMSEGLSDYLSTNDRTGAPVADHGQRLATYRQKLQEALKQSRPLVEINTTMNATVHPEPLDYVLNVQGFPFGEGHPARNITAEIIQGFQKSAEPVDYVFSSGETESVLISNFLKHPVHPAVLTSFTQPLTNALAHFNTNDDLLRSAFWQWRRARNLENFIPLPDSLRIAAIRGFAVARSIGLMTAEPQKQNVISTPDGLLKFPRALLTATNAANVLPALLEAMVLTFAEASTRGKSAFEAYGALVTYGTGGGLVGDYEVSGVFEKFLRDGDYGVGNGNIGPISVTDEARANAARGSDMNDRCDKVMHYLRANLDRLDKLSTAPIDPKSWRNQDGVVEPADTLTLEILPDMRRAYVEVLQAVERFKTVGGVIP